MANRKSLLGEGAKMKGRSLGYFSIANPYRLAVFKFLYSKVCLQPGSRMQSGKARS